MRRRCAGWYRWMTASRAWRRPPNARCCADRGRLSGAARCTGNGHGPAAASGGHACVRWMAASRSRPAGPRRPRSRRRQPSGSAWRTSCSRTAPPPSSRAPARRRRAVSAAAAARPVVVTRAEDADGPLSRELRGLGLEVLLWPAVSVSRRGPGAAGRTRWPRCIRLPGSCSPAGTRSRPCSSSCPRRPPGCASPPSARRPRRCCASAAGPWTWCRRRPTPRPWWPRSARSSSPPARGCCFRPARARCRRSPPA